MTYFDHEYISRSDLIKLANLVDPNYDPPKNLQQIFDQGTLNHLTLFEPHKSQPFIDELIYKIKHTQPPPASVIIDIDKIKKDYELAKVMADTVLKDKFCRDVIMMKDFRREHEWYEPDFRPDPDIKKLATTMGFDGVRCKTDGDSRLASVVFEYKGLKVSTESGFVSAIEYHGYDMSSTWYLNTTGLEWWLIAAVSKDYPKRLFKRIVNRDHKYYLSGHVKIEKAKSLFRQYVGPVS